MEYDKEETAKRRKEYDGKMEAAGWMTKEEFETMIPRSSVGEILMKHSIRWRMVTDYPIQGGRKVFVHKADALRLAAKARERGKAMVDYMGIREAAKLFKDVMKSETAAKNLIRRRCSKDGRDMYLRSDIYGLLNETVDEWARASGGVKREECVCVDYIMDLLWFMGEEYVYVKLESGTWGFHRFMFMGRWYYIKAEVDAKYNKDLKQKMI